MTNEGMLLLEDEQITLFYSLTLLKSLQMSDFTTIIFSILVCNLFYIQV